MYFENLEQSSAFGKSRLTFQKLEIAKDRNLQFIKLRLSTVELPQTTAVANLVRAVRTFTCNSCYQVQGLC